MTKRLPSLSPFRTLAWQLARDQQRFFRTAMAWFERGGPGACLRRPPDVLVELTHLVLLGLTASYRETTAEVCGADHPSRC